MSEYIIGDRIEAAEQPYTLTAADLEAVGIRVYGAAGAQTPEDTTGRYWTVMVKNDYHADVLLASVGDTAVAEGAYADVYRGVISGASSIPDFDDDKPFADFFENASAGEWVTLSNVNGSNVNFAFIFEGGTHMTTVTDRIATIEVDGSETVKFAVSHDVYGVYGEDIIASLKEGAGAGDEGAYSTADTGKAIIGHYTKADTLYLTGSGTVTVWAGQSPLDDPFAV